MDAEIVFLYPHHLFVGRSSAHHVEGIFAQHGYEARGHALCHGRHPAADQLRGFCGSSENWPT